jgi:transcriptional antiterminator RfaH
MGYVARRARTNILPATGNRRSRGKNEVSFSKLATMKAFPNLPGEEFCVLQTRPTTLRSSLLPQSIMVRSRAELAASDSPFWFCLKTQPKHEHIAAATLRRQMEIPCFSPRLRFRKATRRGAVWFVEPMFPGYIFAQFLYGLLHRRVEHLSGIQGIVHFGDYLATIDPDTVIALQQRAGDEEIVTIDPEVQVGQPVRIAEGPFRGLEALVTRILPAKERVKVLLEFLGRSVETEISAPKILPVNSLRP